MTARKKTQTSRLKAEDYFELLPAEIEGYPLLIKKLEDGVKVGYVKFKPFSDDDDVLTSITASDLKTALEKLGRQAKVVEATT